MQLWNSHLHSPTSINSSLVKHKRTRASNIKVDFGERLDLKFQSRSKKLNPKFNHTSSTHYNSCNLRIIAKFRLLPVVFPSYGISHKKSLCLFMLCCIYVHLISIFILACGEDRPSNRLWQKITTTNWYFHWDLSLHSRSPSHPTQNLSQKASFTSMMAPRNQTLTLNGVM